MDLYCIQLVLSRSTPHLNLIACRKPGINRHNGFVPLGRSVCILWLNLKRGQKFVRLLHDLISSFFFHIKFWDELFDTILSGFICCFISGLNLISVEAHSHRAKVQGEAKNFSNICRPFFDLVFGFRLLSRSVWTRFYTKFYQICNVYVSLKFFLSEHSFGWIHRVYLILTHDEGT